MTGFVLPLAWAALVLAAGWSRRPAAAVGPRVALARHRWLPGPRGDSAPGVHRVPARARSHRGAATSGRREPTGARCSRSVIGTAGGAVRAACGLACDTERDRAMGWGLVAAVVLGVVHPAAAAMGPLLALLVPRARAARVAAGRQAAVVDELPQVVDLLRLAVEAGLTVPLAIDPVVARAPGPVGSALARAGRRMELGTAPADALGGMVDDAGDAVRPLAAALVTAMVDGTPLVPALDRLATEVRGVRRRRAEEAARRVPVRLLLPLVCCTLPALVLLSVVPLLAAAVGSLRV